MNEAARIVISTGAIRAAPVAVDRVMLHATERMQARFGRLPFSPTHAVTALFAGKPELGPRGGDYTYNGACLNRACELLREAYPEYGFYASGNAYPLPAVQAARLAGLGMVGVNGLLFAGDGYGTAVTIGAVLTDMPLPDGAGLSRDEGYCGKCLVCIQKCPTGALSYDDGVRRFDRERCLSHLYQKGGVPPPENGYYGCDVCQDVCPMNSLSWQQDLAVKCPAAAPP